MPRSGDVYSLPAGSIVVNGTTIDASQHNTPLNDIAADLNAARPIVAGGTGATTAAGALTNLGVTATAAELNFVDGVTSNIQTQLDAKLDTAGLASVAADIVPDADSTRDLGSATKAWALLYLDALEPVGADTTIKRVGGTNTTPIVEGIAKTWVNFNGTGTIAARDSLNVSSLTDNGTGDYTVNFTNAMSAADYMAACNTDANAAGNTNPYAVGAANGGILAGSFRIISFQANSASPVLGYDTSVIMASIHGQLA